MNAGNDFTVQCPLPLRDYPIVTLAHGGGGSLTHQLIDQLFHPAFGNPMLAEEHDGAVIPASDKPLAFTTDSYVVRPIFFPGGDIGTLAINGTVNDLAMCGARPRHLSAAFILEEGLPMETLWRVVQSMKNAALAAGVQVVTGDTKVVDRGKCDGLYINTAGVGVVEARRPIRPLNVKSGDAVILSGDIGRHGIAVMAVREGIEFRTALESDCAPVAEPVLKLIEAGIDVHCLRDLTRGGLATTLVEIARAASVHIRVDEKAVPVHEDVRGACEMLGFDPLYVANEGRFVAFVPEAEAKRAISILHSCAVSAQAVLAGRVLAENPKRVSLRSSIGTVRRLDMLSGEQLPRIC